MDHALLADLIVIVHAAIVGFIVLGEVLILIGWWRKWQWTRNPWLRWSHLSAILIVVLFSLFLGYCPLTEWEYMLRETTGEVYEQGSFVGRLLHRIIFLRLPEWVFTPMYVAFGVLVAATMWFYPPRRTRK